MNRKQIYIAIVLLILILFPVFSFSQQEKGKEKPKPTTRILFVFDASQSMLARWQSDMKITIARKLLSNLLDSLKNVENLELALRVFGHQKQFPPQDCDDTKLEIPFAINNTDKIKYKLKTLIPKGTTPIASSLELSANDFTTCDNCRNIIILITDGIEECGGDPCAVSKALQKKGIALKPFIIGIGKDFSSVYKCVGTYFDAASEQEFHQALNIVISQALNSTTAQVNLLDMDGKPTETNVNMTFYDNFSGLVKYNFIHTFNNKGLPDTLTLDPLTTYNLVVHTTPPVEVDSIVLTPGKHTIIPVETPQGYLNLKMNGNIIKYTKEVSTIVRLKDSMNTINIQSFGQTEKYLVGKYDLEILCLPRLLINDIDVAQSTTTTVEIPQPGIAVIQMSANGYGSVYQEDDNKLKWIYNLRENLTQESLVLQPGKYRVVFRSKYLNKSAYTVEKSFSIQSNSSVTVKLFQN
ncbi:MAG: VWA domain-containing protein [Bacteroidetes bacterium]|nr:VWA domain-containing protein [Bacteroidota bacterium]